MPGESVEAIHHAAPRNAEANPQRQPDRTGGYDPFARGGFPVGVRTIELFDGQRDRTFPCEIWYPATVQYQGQDLDPATQDTFDSPTSGMSLRQAAVRRAAPAPGTFPLVLFSHSSGASRRAASFLCTHLSSHGYVVAALDHSEVIAGELKPPDGETPEERLARGQAWIDNRVPDIRFLVDKLIDGAAEEPGTSLDSRRMGIVGHSFGGWAALAAAAADPRISAVVTLAPAGSSNPRPGILPVTLTFDWGRDVPTLYLVAEDDVLIPLPGMFELFERTQSTKQMVILRRADHSHFADNVELEHEAMRAIPFTGELEWIAREMRPVSELISGDLAHLCVRGLAVAHMDAYLRGDREARRFLLGDLEGELARRGVEIRVHKP